MPASWHALAPAQRIAPPIVALAVLALTWVPGASAKQAQERVQEQARESASLHLIISGVESEAGSVIVQVYGSADGFRDPSRAIAGATTPARPGTLEITLDGLPPGRRAVILYHDENGNGILDRFLGMRPTEGYGVSTTPALAGPPSFDEAAVTLPEGDTRIHITLRY